MRVLVLTKTPPENPHLLLQPVAIVLSGAGTKMPYVATERLVVTSPEQSDALGACNEISKLSDTARGKLDLTFEKIAGFRARAEDGGTVSAGETIYVEVDKQIGAVYTSIPRDKRTVPLKVYKDAEAYFQHLREADAEIEIRNISPKTRQFLDLKP